MQIVMLGHTNAGKTSYMSAMYRTMALEGIGGFRVRAGNERAHQQLLAAGTGLLRGNYPAPSDRRHEYSLTLRHSASALLDFTWKDYRGGALRDRSTVDDTRQLLADLTNADAIVLFLDSVDLQNSASARMKIRNLTTVVFQALENRTGTTPIVITLTKSDLIDESRIDQMLSPFDSFIQAIRTQENVIGTLVPVACGLEPSNVVLPVLFCLYFGVRHNAEVTYANLVAAHGQAQSYAARDTAYNRWIDGKLLGNKTNREYALEAFFRAQQEYSLLEPLLGPIERLEYLLGPMKIF
jgi:GTPase SAR1 family protein